MKRFSKNVAHGQTDLVILEGAFTIGASGAIVASSTDGAGISGVVLGVKPGLYTITLEDKINKMFTFHHNFSSAVASTIGSVQVVSEAVKTDGTITIQCFDITGSEASPASGCTMHFDILLRQSSVLGKGE